MINAVNMLRGFGLRPQFSLCYAMLCYAKLLMYKKNLLRIQHYNCTQLSYYLIRDTAF